nr:SIMPL domain-containing protein [Neobacillus sp. Marseille-Q6967]
MYTQNPLIRNQQLQKTNLIKVTGEGVISIQPDTAKIHLGVITENIELNTAQQQNSSTATKVIQSLLSLGIDKKQIQTFEYRIEPIYDFEQGKQIFRGYKITHILQVNIEDISLTGKVVDTAVQNGANYVSNIQFTSKFIDTYYNQALALALNNANEKAKTIANTLRVSLLMTPIQIKEEGSLIQPFEIHQVSSAKGFATTPIQPGQLTIKANISAEFLYQI